MKWTHASLFSGIGGFDLAAEWMGWENIMHCERDPFCQQVLQHHWPEAVLESDVKKLDGKKYAGRTTILTGGFPCQPYSQAGQRKGTQDDRHLWPEMLRIIREIEPTWVVGENVRGLLNWTGPEGQPSMVFTEIIADMEAAGYQIWPYLLPAAGVNAPHQRQRIFFIARHAAHTHGTGQGSHPRSGTGKTEEVWGGKKGNVSAASGSDGNAAHTQCHGLEHSQKPRSTEKGTGKVGQFPAEDAAAGSSNGPASHPNSQRQICRQKWRQTQKERKPNDKQLEGFSKLHVSDFEMFPSFHPICGGNDGLSAKLDGISFPKWRKESLKAYGNAVVPPLIFQIFKAIEDMERLLAEGRKEITFKEFKQWKEH